MGIENLERREVRVRVKAALEVLVVLRWWVMARRMSVQVAKIGVDSVSSFGRAICEREFSVEGGGE